MQPTNDPYSVTWEQRWITWRNKVFSSPRFRRFAMRNPLMRPVSRAKAESLFNLINGFVYTQVVLACVRTGLIPRLAAGPLSVADVATIADLPVSAAERLLKAAASIDLTNASPTDATCSGRRGRRCMAAPVSPK